MEKILVCDDEKDIVNAIAIYLQAEGYTVEKATNGEEVLELLEKEETEQVSAQDRIKLILLDVMMPKMDGITTLSKLREFSNLPVILLTAKSEDADKVLGLNIGADDYVTKPFGPLELIARVKSQLRRYTRLGGITGTTAEQSAEEKDEITHGGLSLNDRSKEVRLDGELLNLTPIEYDLLKFFMENPGQVFSPADIYGNVWKEKCFGSENTVAVHIRHLREKIEINPSEPRYIKVVWGHGYKME